MIGLQPRKIVLILVSLACLTFPVQAQVKVLGPVSDNMVLQRGMEVPIWGTAPAGSKLSVAFNGQSKTATAADDGTWMVRLNAMPANKSSQDLTVTGPNTLIYKNIVVGDIWICSGQSNMAWTVAGAANKADEIAAANYPLIRQIKIPNTNSGFPRADVSARWVVCSPKTVSSFTAVGYFFGRHLHRTLGVPIGLISSNWGGTRIEPWTPPAGFQAVPELKTVFQQVSAWNLATESGRDAMQAYVNKVEAWVPEAKAAITERMPLPAMPESPIPGSHQAPTKLYNGMIHPLIPFAIRGAIWYQGESNGREGESYFHKMQALIGGWRQLWQQGDFPFYYVQLANFRAPTKKPEGGGGWSKLREAQRQALTIPNTGMAVIIDIGEAGNIHPRNKQDVGKRLALWALAREYDKDLVYSGPLYTKHEVDGSTIRVHFDHVGSGLMVGAKEGLKPARAVPDGELQHFAIAGADKTWHWATAVIEGATVVVSSPKVKAPVAVRYAYAMNPASANLYNKDGLPASPFRTDDW